MHFFQYNGRPIECFCRMYCTKICFYHIVLTGSKEIFLYSPFGPFDPFLIMCTTTALYFHPTKCHLSSDEWLFLGQTGCTVGGGESPRTFGTNTTFVLLCLFGVK